MIYVCLDPFLLLHLTHHLLLFLGHNRYVHNCYVLELYIVHPGTQCASSTLMPLLCNLESCGDVVLIQ